MLGKRAKDHVSPGIGFERVVFFSDAVFAIAITLLVLDLKLPEGAHGLDLGLIASKLLGFAISFFVIGIYWMAHHRLFEALKTQDSATRVMNLAFLACVVFLPFPTGVIAQAGAVPGAVQLYAGAVAVTGLAFLVLGAVAGRRDMLANETPPSFMPRLYLRSLGVPLVFLASAVVAAAQPLEAMYMWAATFPVAVVLDRLGRLVWRRADAQFQGGETDA